jgi:hypothetical protein
MVMGMADYVNKEMFLSSMGLVGDETKYGNRDAEHSNRSYGTWMGYEIMDSIDDSVEEDVVKVVQCKDCKFWDDDFNWCDRKCVRMQENDFCSYGERKDNEV